MAASLDVWEQSLIEVEAGLKARAGTTHAEFALLYADHGRFDDAIRAMGGAIAAEPTRASLYAFQGLLQEANGRDRDAALTFALAARTDPADPVAAYLAASVLPPAARAEGLKPFVRALLAAADGRSAVPQAAFVRFELISDLLALVPMFSPASYADGFDLFSRGRYRDAVAQFRTALASDPLVTDPAGRNAVALAGVAALREKRGARAIEQLETAVAALPQSSEAQRLLGVGYRAVARLPESIRHLEAAVRLAPRDERARVTLGSTLAEAGRLADAERVLRDAITALPSSGRARWALADVYRQLNRGLEAIAVLEEAASLTVVAGKTLIYERITNLAYRHHDYDRVIAALAQRARLVRHAWPVHRDLGLEYARIGRNDEALIELLMATLLDVADAGTWAAIGQIHLAAERLEDAERALRRAVAADARNAQARYVLGTTLIRLDRAREGQQHLDEFKRLRAAAQKERQRRLEEESKP
jgi:tetratricopeptide (TPR) repeat protein